MIFRSILHPQIYLEQILAYSAINEHPKEQTSDCNGHGQIWPTNQQKPINQLSMFVLGFSEKKNETDITLKGWT